MVNVPHGPEFFQQMATCKAAYERLGYAMAAALPNSQNQATLLDIGCGLGYQTAVLARHGFVCDAVDPFSPGAPTGVTFVSGDPIECAGLCPGPYDVVICTETAEHVYPERANELVLAVANRMAPGGFLIWSAARPGQDWEGHVNLQEPGYWFDRFERLDVRVDHVATAVLRLEMLATQAQHCSAADNFVMMRRDP